MLYFLKPRIYVRLYCSARMRCWSSATSSPVYRLVGPFWVDLVGVLYIKIEAKNGLVVVVRMRTVRLAATFPNPAAYATIIASHAGDGGLSAT